jgi:hypothetical protein
VRKPVLRKEFQQALVWLLPTGGGLKEIAMNNIRKNAPMDSALSVSCHPGPCPLLPAGMSGTCSADFYPGSTVTLMQSPDSNSTWAVWSYPNCGTNQNCQVVMNGAKNVTATFAYAHMAKVFSTGNRLYDTLADAQSHTKGTDTILARDVTFGEDLTLIGKIITLTGGLSPWCLPQNAWTTLHGRLTLQSGSMTVDKLVIK